MNKGSTKPPLVLKLMLLNCVGLGFFKNYCKEIKAICKENEEDFQ